MRQHIITLSTTFLPGSSKDSAKGGNFYQLLGCRMAFDASDSYSGHVRNFTLHSAIAGRGSTRLGILGDFVTDDGSKISTYGRYMDFLQAAHACEKVGCWFPLG